MDSRQPRAKSDERARRLHRQDLSQVVEDVPANTSRALLPEDITNPILKRSARIGKIRHLRIL
jgi:hypothetical protein